MKTGIVLEGGGSRGVFTSGVLDEMMERGLTFDYCVGVSAGAGNAMHLKSRQPERAMRILTHMKEPYYGLGQARSSGKLLDLDAVYEKTSYDPADPFDFSAYYANPMECEYVVSCCETAQPEYLAESVHRKRLLTLVKASCSIPGLCAPVELDGKHYLDGGVADALPVLAPLLVFYSAFSKKKPSGRTLILPVWIWLKNQNRSIQRAQADLVYG